VRDPALRCRIPDREIGVGAWRNRALPAESEQARRIGGGEPDELRHVDASLRNALAEQNRKTRLDSWNAVRNGVEGRHTVHPRHGAALAVGAASGAALGGGEGEAAMIGGDDVERAVLNAAPYPLVLFFDAQGRRAHGLRPTELRLLQVVVRERQILWAGLAPDFDPAGARAGDLGGGLLAGHVKDLDRLIDQLRERD